MSTRPGGKIRTRRTGRARAVAKIRRGTDRCRTPGKRHYPDKTSALAAIVGGEQRPGKYAPSGAYRCACGNGWCLTSKPEH